MQSEMKFDLFTEKAVVGIEPVDYVSSKTNRQVVGVRLTISSPLSSVNGAVGFSAVQYFVADKRSSDFKIGAIITPIFEPGFNGQQKCTGVIYK